jgi:hypothetical protein
VKPVGPARLPRERVRICELCGMLFETNRLGRVGRFCSPAHQVMAWRRAHYEAFVQRERVQRAARRARRGQPRPDTNCPVCGLPVVQPDHGPPKRYCGPPCRQRASRERQRGAT